MVAVGIYANFFTHHWIVDLRVPLALAMLLVLRRCWVHFTVGPVRHRMPLAASFLLIGVFLWVAENAATFLDAWKYPGQVDVWEAVHVAKLGSWALLVSMSFVLVATVKSFEGRLYHVPGEPHVTPDGAGGTSLKVPARAMRTPATSSSVPTGSSAARRPVMALP